MKAAAFVFALLIAAPAFAQESRLASDWRREREKIAENCTELKKLASCAMTLVTDYPVHIAVGSLSPQNGFGFGLAFVERYTPNENWRISFNADAVTSTSASWRTGGYVTFVRTNVGLPTVSTGPATSPSGAIREYPVFRVYVQRSVMKHLVDFGPDFANPVERVFGETQTILGGSAVYPINAEFLRPAAMSLIGGIQGRLITIHDTTEGDDFTELFEEVRVKPSLWNGNVRLNYSGKWQQFLGDSDVAFRRWTMDLRHEVPLYRGVASTGPAGFNGNGPDDCSVGPSSNECPALTFSRNRYGSVNLRLLMSSSAASNDEGAVPFYLQPTVGGQDINNQRLLASFDDYRFRGPRIIAMQASLEHSIWGPVGGYLMLERAKAVQEGQSLNFDDLRSSYSAGLTLRAGGAPVVTASYGWGGDNRRFIFTMDASLLGGSPRPSLH